MIQNPPLIYKIIEKKLKCLLLFLCLIQRNFSTSAALSSLFGQIKRAECYLLLWATIIKNYGKWI